MERRMDPVLRDLENKRASVFAELQDLQHQIVRRRMVLDHSISGPGATRKNERRQYYQSFIGETLEERQEIGLTTRELFDRAQAFEPTLNYSTFRSYVHSMTTLGLTARRPKTKKWFIRRDWRDKLASEEAGNAG
jgi:hypothetical protein